MNVVCDLASELQMFQHLKDYKLCCIDLAICNATQMLLYVYHHAPVKQNLACY